MPVEKMCIRREGEYFTNIPNSVLQGVKNLQALGLWCYLMSLPEAWEFHKSHLRDRFGIGVHALNSLLKLLESYNLVNIRQVRDECGKFAHFDMLVRNGMNFKINDLSNDEPFYKNRNTETVHTDISTYKRNNNKIKKENKISCASAEKKSVDNSFEEFWKNYPVKKNPKGARRIWEKHKYGEKLPIILKDIHERLRNDHQWQNKNFIPHPSTYLNNERWLDEIVPTTRNAIKANPVRSEARSTVREWCRGNPDYDRLHSS